MNDEYQMKCFFSPFEITVIIMDKQMTIRKSKTFAERLSEVQNERLKKENENIFTAK